MPSCRCVGLPDYFSTPHAYIVLMMGQFVRAPHSAHYVVVLHIAWYFRGTITHSLLSSFVLAFLTYPEDAWASNPIDHVYYRLLHLLG